MGLAGKNILVTGGTGFIGSHLVASLIEKKCNVIVPYQSLNPKSYFFEQKLDDKVILVQKDLKNFRRTIDIVTKYEIDFIYHLAAQAIVTTAYYNPVETFETNIMGTVNILEAARLYGNIKGIIVTSSDKAYGKISRARETDPLNGDHPYETSKSAADLIAKTYFKTYGLPVAITRFGNVYGEGDINFSRIIPGIMKTIINHDNLLIRSNGKYVRDYVYVGDIVKACIEIAQNINSVKGESFNISSNQNMSVIAIVKLIENILGVKIKYQILSNTINEIQFQSVDYKKIRSTFGWKPKDKLETTIENILTWYTNYFEAK